MSGTTPSERKAPSVRSRCIQDDARLEALRDYEVFGTDPEPAFDRITDLAASLFDAPASIINFVADDRQWFKSTIGVDEQETGLDISFCVYTIAEKGPFVVEDLAADDRFADNPYVTEGGMRFYAGAPLTTPDEHRIGTLCILDTEPRSPSPEALDRLEDLAAMVVDELELRREQAERAETADRLRRSRDLLRQSQRLTEVGGWAYDVEADTLSWTDETYRIHDYAPDRSIDVEQALAFYADEAQSVIEEHFQCLLDEGGTYDLELPIVTAEGRERWVRTIGEAHRDHGTTVRVSGAIQDVTDRRRTRRRLRTQKDLLRTIFDNIPVMIALFDEKGRFELVNQAFEGLLGWDEEEVVSRSDAVQKLFPDPERQDEALQFVKDAAGCWEEFTVQDREGASVHVLGMTVALRDGRRIGIGIDVTEKRERQERLRLLEAAVEYARVPVLITEANRLDEPAPRIQYANPAFTEVSGYEADDVMGRSPRFLQGPDTDRAALDRIRTALENEESVREVVRNYAKDGTMYWNDLYIAPVPDETGEVTHFVSVQADVTERVERRQELTAAKEAAEEADRMKTALLSNMNHEFRTPLTSIISFAKLIGSSPELAEKFAPRILGGGQRLLRTLNAVMDLAELEQASADTTPQRLNLQAAAQAVVEEFRAQADRTGVSLQVEAPEAPVTALLDRRLVERTLTHLVSNAVKFTEEGDVTIRVQEDEEAVVLAVADTGIGIPETAQSKVCDEFYQASAGNDRTHEGNGIGLTIATRMVDRLGGTLEIDSERGEGTTVTVRLPARFGE